MRYIVKIEFTTEVTNGIDWFTERTFEFNNIVDAVDTFKNHNKAIKKAVIIDTENNEVIATK